MLRLTAELVCIVNRLKAASLILNAERRLATKQAGDDYHAFLQKRSGEVTRITAAFSACRAAAM